MKNPLTFALVAGGRAIIDPSAIIAISDVTDRKSTGECCWIHLSGSSMVQVCGTADEAHDVIKTYTVPAPQPASEIDRLRARTEAAIDTLRQVSELARTASAVLPAMAPPKPPTGGSSGSPK